MNLRPLNNNVVIEQQEEQETQYKGIIVADISKDAPKIGTVIAVGPGVYTITGTLVPCTTKPGDKVAFPSFGGIKFTIGNKDYIAMKETDLITIIENEK